ncbi:hypothetical protein ACF07Y_42430 [Streptomyces sp. NPDC016566]|uniref:hypothetical protein n=1 Tax=Streptomyces sp. NPDC016566 TaxID=3364967 RepID=UPI0036F6BAF2
MARSWTRLHEHLGAAPGPLDFGMVAKAAADRLAESDDLDWKEQLPQPRARAAGTNWPRTSPRWPTPAAA